MSPFRTIWGALVVLCTTTTMASIPASAQQGQKPNILFIMGDDIGWMQPSIYHQGLMVGERRTSIASARRARSSPTTTPSRAARRGGTHSLPACIRCAQA